MSESMKLPVGIDKFQKIRTKGIYYIDKTRLIEQLYSNFLLYTTDAADD